MKESNWASSIVHHIPRTPIEWVRTLVPLCQGAFIAFRNLPVEIEIHTVIFVRLFILIQFLLFVPIRANVALLSFRPILLLFTYLCLQVPPRRRVLSRAFNSP
jgi:hypothetical protein